LLTGLAAGGGCESGCEGGAIPRKGFVTAGCAGGGSTGGGAAGWLIRLSRFTRDEFSPRNVSGVFCLPPGCMGKPWSSPIMLNAPTLFCEETPPPRRSPLPPVDRDPRRSKPARSLLAAWLLFPNASKEVLLTGALLLMAGDRVRDKAEKAKNNLEVVYTKKNTLVLFQMAYISSRVRYKKNNNNYAPWKCRLVRYHVNGNR